MADGGSVKKGVGIGCGIGIGLVLAFVIVVVILPLIGISMCGISGLVSKKLYVGKIEKAQIDIERIGMALDMYAVENGKYPTTEQGLDALLVQPTFQPLTLNWNGPYVKEGTRFMDAWSNLYVYESPSTHGDYDYDLFSYGPDMQEGGKDDITSWVDISP